MITETEKFVLFWITGRHSHTLELTRTMATKMSRERKKENTKLQS